MRIMVKRTDANRKEYYGGKVKWLLKTKCANVPDFAQNFNFVYVVYLGSYLLNQNKTTTPTSIFT